MNKRSTFAVILICAASLVSVAGATIVADGDFEAGTGWPDGWLYHGDAANVAGAGVGGSNGGEITSDNSSIHGLLNVFAPEVGGDWGTGEWIMTFDAKNTDGATNVQLGLLGVGFADWEDFTLSTDWQSFSGSVVFPSADNGDVFFYQRGAGSVQIDNVVLEAVPEPASLGLLGLVGGGIFFIRRRFTA